MRLWLSLIAGLALMPGLAWTETRAPGTPSQTSDPFSDPLIQKVHKMHTIAVEGDSSLEGDARKESLKEATKQLVPMLEDLTKELPENALLQCYLGSAYTLASRDAWIGPQKYSFLKKGLETMDAAVKRAPDSVSVRFVRAMNNYMLPFFIGRTDNAREDFQILLKQLEEGGDTLALNTETKQGIYHFAGSCMRDLKHKKRAVECWNKSIALDPQSRMAEMSREALAKMESRERSKSILSRISSR